MYTICWKYNKPTWRKSYNSSYFSTLWSRSIHSIFNIVLLAPSDVCATLYMHAHTHTHTHTYTRSYIYTNFNSPYANSHIIFLPVLKTGHKSSKLTSWIIQLLSLTFWHRSFTFNSNKSPTWFNSFSVYYPDVCLQLNKFRAFSRPSSGAQW